jgi:Kef-type K+ transport system membrane component KefB
MTATLGFIHGLVSGRKFNSLETIEAKANMWRKLYFAAFVSAIALALSANKDFLNLLRTPSMTAVFIGLASATMASSVSFQFYQAPAFVSNEFLKLKAVCLSFMDGLGFVVTALVFAMVSKIVSHPSLGTHGWSVAWAMFAVILGIGGTMMTSIIPPVLGRQIGKRK